MFKRKSKTYYRDRCSVLIIALAMSATFGTTSAFAQTSTLVVTPEEAKRVGANAQSNLKTDIEIFDLRDLGIKLETEIKTPAQDYADTIRPVIDLDARKNTDFTVGLLSRDTADDKTYRDPYSIDNIEINPIYPEGRYVDTLKASAGLGLSSDF